jgi:hypothetical protein
MSDRIKGGKYLDRYFTQFPNIIDDSDLDVYEFRLLIHYYRVGECWEGIRTTALKCKMSVGKASAVRQSLAAKGFINIEPEGDGVTITVVDKAADNMQRYSRDGCSPDEQGVHHMNASVHHMNDRCSPGEHKNNPIKNNPLRTSTTGKSKKDKWSGELGQLYKAFIDVFDKRYHEIGFFGKRDGAAVKSIIVQTIGYCQKQGKEPTHENVLEFWRIFVSNLEKTWGHGKDLATINGKYMSLIFEMKNNGKQRKATTGRQQPVTAFTGVTNEEELWATFERETKRTYETGGDR